jgi:hypothetical protein
VDRELCAVVAEDYSCAWRGVVWRALMTGRPAAGAAVVWGDDGCATGVMPLCPERI